MKKIIILITIFLSVQSVIGQKQSKEITKENELEIHKKIIKQAIMYNDAQTAINSMHFIIAKEGTKSIYKDSLALIYFRIGNLVSSHLLAEELLVAKPQDLQLLEINAISLQNLNSPKEAIKAYEVLFANTKNMAHGYQLAALQFELKRYGEAQTTLEQALQCEDLKEAKIQFLVDTEKKQNVAVKAAIFNLKGLLAYQLKDSKASSLAFEEALTIQPDFAYAKKNKEAIELELKK